MNKHYCVENLNMIKYKSCFFNSSTSLASLMRIPLKRFYYVLSVISFKLKCFSTNNYVIYLTEILEITYMWLNLKYEF